MKFMRWFTGILGMILGGFAGGFWWSLGGFGIGFLGWQWLVPSKQKSRLQTPRHKKSSSSTQPLRANAQMPPPLPPKQTSKPRHYAPLTVEHFASSTLPSFGNIAISTAPDLPKRGRTQNGAQLTWHVPEQPVGFAELTLRHGWFYSTSGELRWPGEPSAINTSLQVAKRAEHPGVDLGYYPSYEGITAAQRRTYLEWLAAGRRDDDPGRRALGYVFLAFYGLERRLLADQDPDGRILAEVQHLLQHYGSAHRSRSLQSYFLQLLHFAGWKQGAAAYRALWPDLLQIDGDRPNEEGLRAVLANLHDYGEPMDWTVGYRVALVNEHSKRSTVIARTREKFWELFRQRFTENYPGGMVLQAAKQAWTFTYRPASQALIRMAYEKRTSSLFTLRLSNVLGLHRQFKRLPEIWNSCVEDLSGYSRAVASKKQGIGSAVAAWNALPPRLQAQEPHPVTASVRELLSSAPQEFGFSMLPVSALASLLELPQRERLTPTQSARLVETLSGAGWFVAPVPQFTQVPFTWTQEVAVYPRQAGEVHEPQIPALVRLLYLAVCLAAADGVIEDSEIAAFNQHIGHELHREQDWRHIRAMEAVLRRDANMALRALPQISRHITKKSRPLVFRALLHIAAADGEIGLDEMKILRRISRAFEMEDEALDDLLRNDVALREIRVAGRSETQPDQGEPIPRRGGTDDARKSGLQLDMARLQALQQETHEVISLLSEVMSDEEIEAASTEVSAPQTSSSTEPEPAGSQEWMQALDRRYHAALLHLTRHDELSPEDFDQLASRHHLMPDDLLHAVNAWADEILGDFLLERAENVHVFLDLLPPEALTTPPTSLSEAA